MKEFTCERPVIRRTYVQVRDCLTKKSTCITIYHASGEQVMELLQRGLKQIQKNPDSLAAAGR